MRLRPQPVALTVAFVLLAPFAFWRAAWAQTPTVETIAAQVMEQVWRHPPYASKRPDEEGNGPCAYDSRAYVAGLRKAGIASHILIVRGGGGWARHAVVVIDDGDPDPWVLNDAESNPVRLSHARLEPVPDMYEIATR